jgi:hypothetical protein
MNENVICTDNSTGFRHCKGVKSLYQSGLAQIGGLSSKLRG